MTMYGIYREHHPATGVEHAVYCYLIHPYERNLVIAAGNSLKIYRLSPTHSGETLPKMTLQCLLTVTLSDQVLGMDSTHRNGIGRDSLFLTFREAKLSVLDYDPRSHQLKTTIIYNLENRDIMGGWRYQTEVPIVRVDPHNRCAVVLVGGHHLAILPLSEVRRFPGKEVTAKGNLDEITAAASKGSHQPIYYVSLKSVDSKCDTVHDMKFLYGYYEPTLFILFEPLRSYAGRMAVRFDTCGVIALSINMGERVHPVIWSLSSLPSDAQQVYPVPLPVGGVLVIGANFMLYLNQNMPPFGISMNSIADNSTQFLLQQKNEQPLSLDGCKLAFLDSDRLVVGLRSGELHMIHFVLDPSRAVRNFRFDKIGKSVLTTCMVKCEDGYIFLGCRLSNSLLIRYTKERLHPDSDEPSRKRSKAAEEEVDDIDIEIFGKTDSFARSLDYKYSFDLSDKLVNIGPVSGSCIGATPYLSEEYSDHVEPGMNIDLVLTSGYGKHGALSVLQKTIRPNVIHSVPFSECLDIFTAKGQVPGTSYLFLSRGSSTSFLAAAEEIDEIDDCPDVREERTVFGGDLGKYILQVSPKKVRFLRKSKIVLSVPMDKEDIIKHVSVADPYILMLTEGGQVLLATFTEEEGKLRLNVTRPSGKNDIKVEGISVFADRTGLFARSTPDYVKVAMETMPVTQTDPDKELDEDELLYGDTSVEIPGMGSVFPGTRTTDEEVQNSEPFWKKLLVTHPVTYWAIFVRENHHMEIVALPNCERVFVSKDFHLLPRVLYDSEDTDEPDHEFKPQQERVLGPEEVQPITEMMVVELGKKVILFVLCGEDLVVYEAFPYYESMRPSGLKLRWRKLDVNIVFRMKKGKKSDGGAEEINYGTRLQYFENVGGYTGVFLSGPYPHWIFMTKRGELRIHPQSIDGPVKCFTPFDNINAKEGFVYANKQSEVRICVLPSSLDYDAPWPYKKVPLQGTPYYVGYHCESKTYAVVTSKAFPVKNYYRFSGDDKEMVDIGNEDPRFPINPVQRFFLQIVTPTTWELVPHATCAFEEWEHVTSSKTVELLHEGSSSGYKGYIACSTNFSYGEDITSRGRVVIFDVVNVVPEPGKPLTKFKLKVIYAKEQKGPVTSLCACKGLLCTAIGQKIYLWQLKDDDLVGMAFIDVGIYVNQCICIKNFILISDILKSIAVLRFQEDYRNLSLVGSDHKTMEVLACGFLIDNGQLGFIASDNDKNISVFLYVPESRDSIGGSRLIPRCDFRVNSKVHTFFRIQCRKRDLTSGMKHSISNEKKQVTYLATCDGNIGSVLPLPEKTYRRLSMLMSFLNHFIAHPAGLNPKGTRTFASTHNTLFHPVRNILDGDLVFRFLSLPVREKKYVADRIGLHVNDIVGDLLEIDRLCAHF
ncbi:unnamed protein product [Cyprideis torosa]|uniref:Uncharacterized protein n=1 Tax=Cyprideis torosa TaxID=163714 RepID=A0A7R8W3P4_9CRUS|nr:unnamed protein product [Cyprideis torosa]CAG0879128.1 unnamed protein product [Cyprideis torosa]